SVFYVQEEAHQKRTLKNLTKRAKRMGFQLIECETGNLVT
ncbi:MAG: hypothetical protein ACI8PB_005539, partial [Desulforhopalus sp.]